MDPNNWLMTGSAPAISWDGKAYGYSVTGTICREAVMNHQTELGTGEPLYWDDARTRPKMQMVVFIKTDLRDPTNPADDGERALYVKDGSSMKAAIADAIRRGGGNGLEYGGTLTVTFTGEEPSKTKGFRAKKVFRAEYRPPTGQASAAFFSVTGSPTPASAAPAATYGQGSSYPQPGQGSSYPQPAYAGAVPAGVDPAAWNNLDEARRNQMLAQMAGLPANAQQLAQAVSQPPF